MRCDIVIIGAGPAGLWAAKTAADAGLDVVILEENNVVGLPKHCSGWLLGCGDFTEQVFSPGKRCHTPPNGQQVQSNCSPYRASQGMT